MAIKVRKGLRQLIDTIKKEEREETKAVEIRFLSDLYFSITQQAQKEARQPSKSFKPSSMKCCRNMQYQLLGVPQDKSDTSPELIGILESGTDRHLRLQNAICKMKENGIDCEYVKVGDFIRTKQANGFLLDLEIVNEDGMETKIYNKRYNISFMADGIIKYRGKYYILEIKTESTKKHYNRMEMAEEHIPQICAYKLSFGIDEVIMLYEDRDNCCKKAYHKIITDDMVFTNVIEKIEIVNSCISTGELAPASVGSGCRYCPFKTKCRQDGFGY